MRRSPHLLPFASFPRRAAAGLAALAGLVLVAGCGAKTGLRIPDAPMDTPAIRDAGRDTPDTPPICTPGEFEIVPASADVVFAIDRSGSMRLDLDGTPDMPPEQWRWQVLRNALQGAFATLDDRVRVGAKFFPDLIDPGMTPEITPEIACRSTAGIEVPISLTGETAVLSTFDLAEPLGGTPTAVAIAEASAALRMAGSPRRFIVLATDGGPNCNPGLMIDPRFCVCTSRPEDCAAPDTGIYACLDDTRAVSTIRETATAGIPVFVIGIEDRARPDLAAVLDSMALAGGRPRTVPGERSFYSVSSALELAEALDAITGSISRCAYVTPSVPVDESRFSIEIGGMRIPRSQWEWVDRARGELELLPGACELATRTGRVVAIVDECPR